MVRNAIGHPADPRKVVVLGANQALLVLALLVLALVDTLTLVEWDTGCIPDVVRRKHSEQQSKNPPPMTRISYSKSIVKAWKSAPAALFGRNH